MDTEILGTRGTDNKTKFWNRSISQQDIRGMIKRYYCSLSFLSDTGRPIQTNASDHKLVCISAPCSKDELVSIKCYWFASLSPRPSGGEVSAIIARLFSIRKGFLDNIPYSTNLRLCIFERTFRTYHPIGISDLLRCGQLRFDSKDGFLTSYTVSFF